MTHKECPTCHGARLKPTSLAVTIGGKNIYELSCMSVLDTLDFINGLQLTPTQQLIGGQVLKEIRERLSFLKNVGLGYLTLARASGTLSGGEAQRIRLATQIGSSLMGVLYILDEPSIGLHQRDNQKLIETQLKSAPAASAPQGCFFVRFKSGFPFPLSKWHKSYLAGIASLSRSL